MAIRVRKIEGHLVALCAAKTQSKEGDVYLDDSIHHALFTKFAVDLEKADSADPILVELMVKEEEGR